MKNYIKALVKTVSTVVVAKQLPNKKDISTGDPQSPVDMSFLS